MHPAVKNFVSNLKKRYPNYFKNQLVIEAGSLYVNGSVKSFFRSKHYIGLDLQEGKGVTTVCPVHKFNIPPHLPRQCDVVISTEMLEHDKHWQQSLEKMYALLRPGGALIITCGGPERAEHGTIRTEATSSPFTTDYYRNLTLDDFTSVLPVAGFARYEMGYVRGDKDFQFFGIKK